MVGRAAPCPPQCRASKEPQRDGDEVTLWYTQAGTRQLTLKKDFEEWLRNEPLQPEYHDSITIRPLPPSKLIASPMELTSSQPKVSIPIITPALLTDMRLAYNSHWLEEQRKAQQGGAMTIGVTINPLFLGALANRNRTL